MPAPPNFKHYQKTQSEIDISPFLKTQKPSILYSIQLFIMKTSHKSDEFKKKGGSTNRVPMPLVQLVK